MLSSRVVDNFDTYSSFLTSDDYANYDDRKANIYGEGELSCRRRALVDALPLVVSNLLHKIARILCSNGANPVYEIKTNGYNRRVRGRAGCFIFSFLANFKL